MQALLFERFIKEKPYKSRAFLWRQPAKVGATGWRPFNVVLDEGLANRLRDESHKLDVSLQTYLLTGLVWWINLKDPSFSLDQYEI